MAPRKSTPVRTPRDPLIHLPSSTAPGIVFTLAFAAAQASHDHLPSSTQTKRVQELPKINIHELLIPSSRGMAPCSPPPTAPCSPPGSGHALSKHQDHHREDDVASASSASSEGIIRALTPLSECSDSMASGKSLTGAMEDASKDSLPSSVTTANNISKIPRRHSLPVNRISKSSSRRPSLHSQGKGVDLSVRIHGIIASDLLKARLLGPGRSSLLRPEDDGTIVLPVQIHTPEPKDSTTTTPTTAPVAAPIKLAVTTVPDTTTTTASKKRPAPLTPHTPTSTKRSTPTSDSDSDTAGPSKKRRHSAPALPVVPTSTTTAKPVSKPAKKPIVPATASPGPAPALGACQFCGARKTGQWRRGPAGQRTLCNACGINWSKKVKAEALRRGCSVAEAEAIVGADEKRFRKGVRVGGSDEEEGEEEVRAAEALAGFLSDASV
ncbi:hypothetical protein HDU96_000053 [Phlyctochytrium bullatum]|nr:hypothetical protein HDU96_000053 [Phlyctochytrium bullatum]